jgi:hypothetical protein
MRWDTTKGVFDVQKLVVETTDHVEIDGSEGKRCEGVVEEISMDYLQCIYSAITAQTILPTAWRCHQETAFY